MIARFLLSFALAATCTLAQAAPQMPSRVAGGPADVFEAFRAPEVPAIELVRLGPPAKRTTPVLENGRLLLGAERALPSAKAVSDWAQVPEGAVSRFRATSESAAGLRVRLEVTRVAVPFEIRVRGNNDRVEVMTVRPGQSSEVWTPWTEGPTQQIELFVAGGASLPDARIAGVMHFDTSPFQKAASTCTVPIACPVNDAALDPAIQERKNSSVRLLFNEGGKGFACSGTLINAERPGDYIVTANHCISTGAAAGSTTSFFFYEGMSCADPTPQPGVVQRSGASLVFTNHNADATLLQMSASAPPGAVHSGWNSDLVTSGEPIVSISHPRADTTRLATGTMARLLRITDRSQDEYAIDFTRGIIEGGSSGSGLFTMSGGSLQLRGILTGSTIRNGEGLTCTNLNEQALYGRFDIFGPQIAQYLRNAGPTPDDTPNRVQDWFSISPDVPLDNRTVGFDRRFEFVGDVDVFRFALTSSASVTLSTEGTLDTIGTLMDSEGKTITTNDDVAFGNLNFGITRTLEAGTYYVMVAPWDPNDVGNYRVVLAATTASTPGNDTSNNYTDLWWNASEPGWGINLNHQGTTIFATLYTYDLNGQPMWLFMSNGDRQADGSFSGTVYSATGPAFDASPWGPYNSTAVGTMRLTFTSNTAGTLTYSVNGILVTKSITRYQYSTPATCTFTTADRTSATNYQDLWWNPNEPGWGVNLAHQGNILFATLYTYDHAGRGLWLSMSSGTLSGTRTYSGTLYRSNGPAFNSSIWGSYTLQPVGQMTFSFTDGNNGTLTYTVNGVPVTKSIRRFVYSTPVPLCSSS
jgi:lysyl endopeptidase